MYHYGNIFLKEAREKKKKYDEQQQQAQQKAQELAIKYQTQDQEIINYFFQWFLKHPNKSPQDLEKEINKGGKHKAIKEKLSPPQTTAQIPIAQPVPEYPMQPPIAQPVALPPRPVKPKKRVPPPIPPRTYKRKKKLDDILKLVKELEKTEPIPPLSQEFFRSAIEETGMDDSGLSRKMAIYAKLSNEINTDTIQFQEKLRALTDEWGRDMFPIEREYKLNPFLKEILPIMEIQSYDWYR